MLFKSLRSSYVKALPFLSFLERGEALIVPLQLGARLTFSLTVILIPFRLRHIIAARPQTPIYGDFTDFLLFASDVTLLGTLLLWTISYLLKPYPLKTGPRFLTIPLAGVLITSLVSTFTSVDIQLSIYHFIRLILLTGFFLYVINEIETLKLIAIPVAIQVLIQSLVGIAQFLGQGSVGLRLLGEWELDPAWSGVSVVWAEGTRALRAYGLADHPNILGGSLILGLALMAGWGTQSKKPSTPWITTIFSLGMVAVLLTFSRSAWLAFLVGILFFAEGLRRTQPSKALRAWLGLLGAGALISFPFLWQNAAYLGVRLNVDNSFTQIMIEERSISERQVLNTAAQELFSENALNGVGLGAFPTALMAIMPKFPYNYQPPHMTLLEAAVETGIFGALFYFLALAGPWFAVWLNRKRIHFSPSFLAASAALAAITVIGFFDYYPWLLMPGRLWQVLLWGFWSSMYLKSMPTANPLDT